MMEAPPPRPPVVPEGARFVPGPIPHWHHGDLEAGSGQPLGMHVFYTIHGEPMRYDRYDARGRLVSRRSSIERDWMAAELEHFREEADRFHWSPFVGRFDDATRASIEAIALAGDQDHRVSYAQALCFVDARRGRTATLTFPRADLVLALFRRAAPPARDTLADADTNVFVALALDAMVTLGDRDGLAEWGPRWISTRRKTRPRARLPKGLEAKVRGALEGRWDEGVVARAGRALHAVLHPLLGVPGKTALLVIDPAERAYWIDDDGVRPAPLEVDATSPSLSRWFVDAPSLSSRELTAAEGRGYWLCQRYGRDVLLFGGIRDMKTLSVEPIVDLFVRCPDDAWTERVVSLFEASRGFGGETTDGFESAGTAWIREYRGDLDHLSARDLRWLGVASGALLTATEPKPERSLFAPPPKSRLPTLERRVMTDAAARSAFDSEERTLFERGYFLAGIHRYRPTSPP